MSSIDPKKLEEHLKNIIRNQNCSNDIGVRLVSGEDTLDACIDMITDKIEYYVPEDWNMRKYKRLSKYIDRRSIINPEIKVCEDAVFHELGHRKLRNDEKGLGCPRNIKQTGVILDAVARGMKETDTYSEEGLEYLTNALEDIVDNTNCKRFTDMDGIVLFYAEQGELNGGKQSPLFEALTKLNAFLLGDRQQRKLLRKFYTGSLKVLRRKRTAKIYSRYVKIKKRVFKNSKLDENVGEIDLAVASCIEEIGLSKDRESNLNILFDEGRWPRTFYILSKYLSKLLKYDAPEKNAGSASSNGGYKVPDKSNTPGKINDPMIRRVFDKDNLKSTINEKNNNNQKAPAYIAEQNATDLFYQSKASELFIKAEVNEENKKMKIAPIQSRVFDEDKDDPEKILFGRFIFDEKGELNFAVPRDYFQINKRVHSSKKSFPKLCTILLDWSPSMLFNAKDENSKYVGNTSIVPWGDESRYHYAVMTYYGMEKALLKMGIGLEIKQNLITFNEKAMTQTGYMSHDRRHKIKQRLLNPVIQGWTEIKMPFLQKYADKPESLMITITDGQIDNWSSIKKRFKKFLSDKFYLHFQIGPIRPFVKDIESWGGVVIPIDDPSKMPQKAIEITKGFYKNYI